MAPTLVEEEEEGSGAGEGDGEGGAGAGGHSEMQSLDCAVPLLQTCVHGSNNGSKGWP